MLTNEEMKSGRFLAIQKNRNVSRAAISALENGGTVVITTYTKSTIFRAKNAGMLKMGAKTGRLYIQHGKHWDGALVAALKFTPQTLNSDNPRGFGPPIACWIGWRAMVRTDDVSSEMG